MASAAPEGGITETLRVVDMLIWGASGHAQALGQSMASMVQARCQVWLSQANIPDQDCMAVVAAPVVPGEVFGPALEGALEQLGLVHGVHQRRLLRQAQARLPIVPFANKVAPALQASLLEVGLGESTLRGYVAAISDGHEALNGLSIGSQPLVSQFLRGAWRLRPSRSCMVPSWDLQGVLEAVSKAPFEPLSEVDLEFLTLKAVFLLAITSARRVSELHALSVHPACLRLGCTLFAQSRHCGPMLIALRLSDKRISCSCVMGGQTRGQAVSKQRLARWVVRAIKLAYGTEGLAPPTGVVAHSTRGMAASLALFQGAPLEDICAAAGWMSSLTFARFYRLNVASAVVASILQAGGQL
ncbi:hypothetical protein N1851_023183 [Merluccius polli]|uniref:Tyr recombinase domain-containing protein n=1 Tax=Merluccius polli TaxID=89951 RepID=A0AA47MH08_MERPO|nr:hypothetical protein N1851_023183 [Merluccius polli]